MNDIYEALQELCENSEALFARDFIVDDVHYRIFDYRLAQYTDWLNRFALDARGIMFEIKDDKPVRIVSRPMRKFFNLNENPITMNLDISRNNIHYITEKVDGSLISTYLHRGELRLKSKGSVQSDQAIAAMKWLDKPENAALKEDLFELASTDYTVDMEYVAPTNRIVVGYMEEHLIGLNIRDNYTGQNWGPIKDGPIPFPALQGIWVKSYEPTDDFLEKAYSLVGTEGYVYMLKTGEQFKQKTTWYSTLHKLKDSLNTPRHLLAAVIRGTSDDLRGHFSGDPVAIMLIDQMEQKVIPIYDHIIATVEKFYEDNKHLSRKDYAILGQSIKDDLFGLKMSKYLGRINEFTYQEYCIDHPEWFDIKSNPIKSDGKIVVFDQQKE